MTEALDPLTADDGQPVYTALVKPLADDRLLVCMILEDGGEDAERWFLHTFDQATAAPFLSALDVAIAGGGSA